MGAGYVLRVAVRALAAYVRRSMGKKLAAPRIFRSLLRSRRPRRDW
jgi:hypothetical protein